MPPEKYNIGGTVAENEAFEAFADIPQNRVLLAEKLTDATPVKPVVVEGLTTIEQVFEHFKPQVEMDFETEEGTTKAETLHFRNLGDFGIKGITAQSGFLNDLTMKREQYLKMIKQLKTNKLLRQALADPAAKKGLLDSLHALIRELEEAGK
jgi:predicted component of type VI protein secretion system